MNIMKRDHSLVPSFFDDFFKSNLLSGFSLFNEGNILPKTNIVETDRKFSVEMAAPGMNKEDFRVELDDHVLTIASERTHDVEAGGDDQQYRRREFSYQSFSRSFTLPDTVEADKIKVRYQDGILMLSMPKKKGLKQKSLKTIRIS